MEEPVFITAQQAAERIMTIKIGGALLFAIVIITGLWLIIRWKYSEDRRRVEAENASDRIKVTKTIGVSTAKALEKDGGWKEQYIILKNKYDVLEAHCENLEQLLDSAKGGKFVQKGVNA